MPSAPTRGTTPRRSRAAMLRSLPACPGSSARVLARRVVRVIRMAHPVLYSTCDTSPCRAAGRLSGFSASSPHASAARWPIPTAMILRGSASDWLTNKREAEDGGEVAGGLPCAARARVRRQGPSIRSGRWRRPRSVRRGHLLLPSAHASAVAVRCSPPTHPSSECFEVGGLWRSASGPRKIAVGVSMQRPRGEGMQRQFR